MKVLVLDAMGVIYPVGDDVRGLLCPFITAKQGAGDYDTVEEYYNKASVGKMTAHDLWKAVSIDPQLEDEYLQGFELTPGLLDFLCIIGPASHGTSVQAGDDRDFDRTLRASNVLEVFLGPEKE